MPAHQRGKSTITLVVAVGVVAICFAIWLSRDTDVPYPGPSSSTTLPFQAGWVDDKRIRNAQADEPGAWLAYGRGFEEQRFSSLIEINRETVGGLGIAWTKDLDTVHAVEATPLVVDGIMYFTSTWNVAYAIDARSGNEIWTYDPRVPGKTARDACCGIISRGLAVYMGRVYLATLDGRLIALDAASGSLVWEVDTIIDRSRNYTITGAPRVAADKVYIGNGGAEYGVRGYVTAYDANTGEQAWRFFTVPGDPSLPFEHAEMEMAAETWKGGEWWKIGGGGTVWNSIVYDPYFHSIYLGVGNGTPWTRAIRSPGGGDNLFLSSIVALDADTGAMKWHYQTTPGDNWDYTAVQDMMLADLTVDGVDRKVLMQAPKNGFFYVIDRQDGRLLRAHAYGAVTWASHVDLTTGRPVENPDTIYAQNPQWILPGPQGAHNWQAMAWYADRGLMFFPIQEMPFLYAMPEEYLETGIYKRRPGTWNTAVEFGRYNQMVEAFEDPPESRGYFIAFDPLTGETAWSVELEHPWNGGALATAGGLVFQGNASGFLAAYDVDSGEEVWHYNLYSSIVAPPITYALDGEQYLAILTGSGNNAADSASYKYGSTGRLVVFQLGGRETIPVPPLRDLTIPEPPALTGSADDIDRGDVMYHDVCGFCHGFGVHSGGGPPDLRMLSPESHQLFQAIVRGGLYQDRGMASYADLYSDEDVERIRQYIISRAKKDREEAMAEASEVNAPTP